MPWPGRLRGEDRVRFIESLTVADVAALPTGGATLSVFTNDKGGIIDDTVIVRTRQHRPSPSAGRLTP
jgi:aminomethyltransferase